MYSRIRIVAGLTAILLFLAVVPALAKGGFDFVAIRGPDLEDEVRSSDPALTADFFAFADFYRDRTEAPAQPGAGYEVARGYLQGAGAVIFDRLHYYPETEYVYYDGIAGGGSSEYDRKWYRARPEMRAAFEAALPRQPASASSAGPAAGLREGSIALTVTAALALLLMFTFRARRSSVR